MGSFCSTPALPADEEVFESVVCDVSDLPEGAPKQFKLDGNKPCLVVKHKGEIHAVSDRCTHYGASLANGAFADGVVRCPFHGACFNVESGDIEDFPGLDSLQKFEVQVDAGKVKIRAKKSQLDSLKRVKPMAKRDASNAEEVVIVGGGAAAEACAESLRQKGYTGKLTLLTMESTPPYERIKLSKAMTNSGESLQLRTAQFYEDADIEVRTDSQVTGIDTDKNEVALASGEEVGYTKLILATGSTPRKLDCPGSDLNNIFVLRTPDDANGIAREGKDKNVVVQGSSFIAMEVAAYFAGKANSITVVGRSRPFEKSLGGEIGQFFMDFYEKKGVKFVLGTTIEKANESEAIAGVVGSVTLKNGKELLADLVVTGMGVTPNTTFLKGSGINLSTGGFVEVNKYMETNAPNVWAAGDVVSFPLFTSSDDTSVSIGHWQLAHSLGRNAALNMLGEKEPIRSVPFFWTAVFGMSFRYAGHATNGFDDIVYEGSVSEGSFAAYYCKDEEVVAVGTLKMDPRAAQFANLLKAGKKLARADVNSEWYS